MTKSPGQQIALWRIVQLNKKRWRVVHHDGEVCWQLHVRVRVELVASRVGSEGRLADDIPKKLEQRSLASLLAG